MVGGGGVRRIGCSLCTCVLSGGKIILSIVGGGGEVGGMGNPSAPNIDTEKCFIHAKNAVVYFVTSTCIL